MSVLLATIATVFVGISCRRGVELVPEPTPVTASDLCSGVFSGRVYPGEVRVPVVSLTPTADPDVWEYRPGHPPERFPPTIRVTFRERPSPMPVRPVVVGRVSGVEYDTLPRRGRHLGVVLITSARLAPPASP